MFEISELKAKTLADLQQIAKSIGLTKTSQLNKLDLVYQILDIQAATPSKEETKTEKPRARVEKPKRKRVVKKLVKEEDLAKKTVEPSAIAAEEKVIIEKIPIIYSDLSCIKITNTIEIEINRLLKAFTTGTITLVDTI